MLTATDYYPFGMEMPGRKYNPQNYRYGFNGKENDRSGEWGLGLVQDYGARIYSPGLGRWLSTDPLEAKYPMYSPYVGMGDNPNIFVDTDGRDNILYLVFFKGQNSGMSILKIANAAQTILNSNGINMKVHYIEIEAPKNKKDLDKLFYNERHMDATDGLVYLGNDKVVNSISEHRGNNPVSMGLAVQGGEHMIGLINLERTVTFLKEPHAGPGEKGNEPVDFANHIARAAIHEGVGHAFCDANHSSEPDGSLRASRYNYRELPLSTAGTRDLMAGGALGNRQFLTEPSLLKFNFVDLELIEKRVPKKSNIVPFLFLKQPSDNFSKRLGIKAEPSSVPINLKK